jgi:hypothetical protein
MAGARTTGYRRRVRGAEIGVRTARFVFGIINGAGSAGSASIQARRGQYGRLRVQDLRERVLGAPEISTDGWHPYKLSVRDAFRNSAHGVIVKTLAVTDLRKDAAHRYSPCAVVSVSREVMAGVPAKISTSYVERSNLSIRMGSRRFTRLTNGFSKKLECHAAAVSLYVAHYNFCRVHEALTPSAKDKNTPAMAIGVANHVWSIGELLDAAPCGCATRADRNRAGAAAAVPSN